MRIFNLLLTKSPIDNIPNGQFLLERMFGTESHSADDTDGHCLLMFALLCTDIALHYCPSLFSILPSTSAIYLNAQLLKPLSNVSLGMVTTSTNLQGATQNLIKDSQPLNGVLRFPLYGEVLRA